MIKETKHIGFFLLLGAAVALMSFATSAFCQGPGMHMSAKAMAEAALHKTIVEGDSWIAEKTTTLKSLDIADGANVAAPAGYSLTMTINGVERDIKPGNYEGHIVLTVTKLYPVKFSDTLTHHFRQAILLNRNGIVKDQSVLAAAGNYKLSNGVLSGVDIRSDGGNFNGILVTGGTYTIKDPVINFVGNGGNDFAGFGAAVMSKGKNTTLILDGANIKTRGVVRSTIVANTGSNLIVKNSHIQAHDGMLPAGYVPNVSPGKMKSVPWMLGISGNCRATNVLGNNTTATYINSDISSQNWGVLSIDQCQNTKLTAINSKVAITGNSGYGTFAIGHSTNSFYGSTFNVADYGAIIAQGNLIYAASTPANIRKLNTDLHLHLTKAEMRAMPTRQTTVNSGRFGVMMWGDSTVKITDGTIINSAQDTFLDKGAKAEITVNGSKGVQLRPKNGIILQVMDNDDPGAVMEHGLMANTGVYHEPIGTPARVKNFNLTTTHKNDVVATFSHIALKGNFYNGTRQVKIGGSIVGGPPSSGKTAPTISGRNMILKFERARVAGVITSSTARHAVSTISAANYKQLDEVTNTPSAAINNGVVVTLEHSAWTVTGTSYLTSLTIARGSKIAAPAGKKVTLRVNGKTKRIKAGTYKGEIVLNVTR